MYARINQSRWISGKPPILRIDKSGLERTKRHPIHSFLLSSRSIALYRSIRIESIVSITTAARVSRPTVSCLRRHAINFGGMEELLKLPEDGDRTTLGSPQQSIAITLPRATVASRSGPSTPPMPPAMHAAMAATPPQYKQQPDMEMPPYHQRLRSDSSLAATEPRLSICSTSGTVYESVVVIGHLYGSDNVVYYLIEVRSWEMPLEGYVIRRRYNDFKHFYEELARVMPPTRARSYSAMGLDMLGLQQYSSLLCNPLLGGQHAPAEASPLWSPKRKQDGNWARDEDNDTTNGGSDGEPDVRYSAPAALTTATGLTPRRSSWHTTATLPYDSVRFTASGRARLPGLPSGGVSSFFSTRRMLIEYRIQQFNRILAAAMRDTSPEVGTVLMNFIQEKPGGQLATYVSLSEYAAIDMPWSVERHARRRAMSMGKKGLRDQMAN